MCKDVNPQPYFHYYRVTNISIYLKLKETKTVTYPIELYNKRKF